MIHLCSFTNLKNRIIIVTTNNNIQIIKYNLPSHVLVVNFHSILCKSIIVILKIAFIY